MKFCTLRSCVSEYHVAPLVGAWIEIEINKELVKVIRVAPLVGAWIEIKNSFGICRVPDSVAPLVGAWIEIAKSSFANFSLLSLPLWERGLKYFVRLFQNILKFVAPLVGAWIEIVYTVSDTDVRRRRSPCGSVD